MNITMYELLGLIKDGKAPKKIRYNNDEYVYVEKYGDYQCKETLLYLSEKAIRDNDYNIGLALNNKVEILKEKEICHKCGKYNAEYNQTYCEFCLGISKLEEEKKIPEKIKYHDDSIAWVIDDVGQLSDIDKIIIDTLNSIIDYLDYVKSKGDK